MTESFLLRGSVFLGVGLLAYGASEPPRRIHAVIKDGQTFQLSGNTRPVIARAQDQGEVDAGLALPRITIHFAMTDAQQAELQQLLNEQTTRHSALYHKWLTPEEYAARFGLNSKDIEQVSDWLQAQGFSNVEAARSRTFITFSGTAGQARSAFHTSIHHYVVNGETHFANASDPELPKALEGVVQGVRGLNDIHPKAHLRSAAVRPHFTSSLSGDYFLTPGDFATIYDINPLYGAGIDGGGVAIVIPGQSDIALTDIEAFRTAAGLPANNPQITTVGADPGTITADQGESELDVEWAGGIAKNSTILFVTSQDVTDAEAYAVDNNMAAVMSITYGLCEAQSGLAENGTMSALFQEANALGMTVLAASGDSGAADCDSPTIGNTNKPNDTATMGLAVDLPAALPYVTAVGGTEFTKDNPPAPLYWQSASGSDIISSALTYIPETGWNDSSTSNGLESGGGGASIFNVKPSWQFGAGVPDDGVRDVPDVAFSASPNQNGYLVCAAGSCTNGFRDAATNLDVVGGTSAATPSFAGIVALLDERMGSRQGNINPTLYLMAAFAGGAFHDITTGNNIVPCQQGSPNCPGAAPFQLGFSAGTGYDQVTGLGSVDAYQMISQWEGDATQWGQSASFAGFTYDNEPNVVYIGQDLEVNQLYFTSSGWQNANLTAITGGPIAPTGSAIASFTYKNLPNVVYIDASQHVDQLYFNSTGWHNVDLTATFAAPSALISSKLAIFTYAGEPNIVYVDSAQHVTQLYFTPTGWRSEDLTAEAGGPATSAGGALVTFIYDGLPNVVYIDGNQHVDQLYFTASGWRNADLTAVADGPVAFLATALVTFAYDGQPNLIYVSSNQHLNQLYFTVSGWHNLDLTVGAGGPLASPGSAIAAFTYGGEPNLVYIAENQHVDQLYFTAGGWHNADLTAAADAPLVAPASALTTFSYDGQPNIVYLGADQRVDQLYFSATGWHDADLTTVTSGPLAGIFDLNGQLLASDTAIFQR